VDSAAPRSVFHVNANLPVQMLRKADCATMAGRQQIRDRLGGSTENLNCEIEADPIQTSFDARKGIRQASCGLLTIKASSRALNHR